MTTEKRLDFLEYRQELLFENTEYTRLLFEYRVTRDQHEAIIDIFNDLRSKIDAGEEVYSTTYEQRIYEVVPHQFGNYHFAEFLAEENYKRDSWKEVFKELYGNSPKYKSYFQKQS